MYLFPWTMVGAQGMLLALGHLVQLGHPCGFDGIALLAGQTLIYGVAPHTRHLGDIGRTALPPFYLEGANPHLHQLGYKLKRIQTGGLFDGVIVFVCHIAAALAQSGVRSEERSVGREGVSTCRYRW